MEKSTTCARRAHSAHATGYLSSGVIVADTKKQGKRGRVVSMCPDFANARDCISGRHGFGSTEKILRRNRKIWTRLLNKKRRRHDKEQTEESSDSTTS